MHIAGGQDLRQSLDRLVVNKVNIGEVGCRLLESCTGGTISMDDEGHAGQTPCDGDHEIERLGEADDACVQDHQFLADAMLGSKGGHSVSRLEPIDIDEVWDHVDPTPVFGADLCGTFPRIATLSTVTAAALR